MKLRMSGRYQFRRRYAPGGRERRIFSRRSCQKTGAAPADEAYIIDNEVLNNALRKADTNVSDMIAGPGANLTSEVRNGGNVEYYPARS